VSVTVGHSTLVGSVALEIEFDEHGRLVAHNPAIVSGLDDDGLWRSKLLAAAVGELDMDLPVRQESHVGVHAEIGADNRLDVGRPVKPGRVNHPLDAGRARVGDIDLDTRDLLVLSARHRFEKRIDSAHSNVLQSLARRIWVPIFRWREESAPAHPLRIQQAVKPAIKRISNCLD
jgi:hypothetical protein